MTARLPVLILIVTGLAVSATGCGRRGDLETPSAAAAQARGEKAPEGETVEDRRFILDGLIE